jgi:hypothetical protein
MRTFPMSAWLALLLACGLSTPLRAEEPATASLESVAWLLGHWNRTGLPEGQVGHEHWQVDGAGYAGVGRKLRNGELVFEEKLRIEIEDGVLFYIADVAENAAPVRFRSVEQTDSSIAFENPQHDFPKRITYARHGDQLEAITSGDGRQITFRFERAADEGESR